MWLCCAAGASRWLQSLGVSAHSLSPSSFVSRHPGLRATWPLTWEEPPGALMPLCSQLSAFGAVTGILSNHSF